MSYKKAFQAAKKYQEDGSYELRGDYVLVRLLDIEPQTQSGIYLASKKDQHVNSIKERTPVYGEVLEVGPGYYDPETGELIETTLKSGNIIEVGENEVLKYSFFPGLNDASGSIGRTSEKKVIRKFENESIMRAYEDTLARHVSGD